MNKEEIEKLHFDLLSAWNNQDAQSMASLFSKDANLIGFDGSQINGQTTIEPEMSKIFADHKTASYVWKVEEVRFLSSQIALLRAIVGMIPPGKKEINPEKNAIQSLVAIVESETWKISLFQNTPAQFHGRPQLVDQMTKQLNELIKQ
jgi:uncharacterized protein (TIGR02246 family)